MLTAWSAVADVGHAGGGSRVLTEDLAEWVGDGDLVAIDDDEDLLEGTPSVDHVVGLVQEEVPMLLSVLIWVSSGRSGCTGVVAGRGR